MSLHTSADELLAQTQFEPEDLDDTFDLKDLISQLETAASDGNAYFQSMLQAEKWRLCEWDNKDPKRSGRRVSLPGAPARPYENAPDHEVYLIQEHLNYRRLLRRAALAGGRINVSPHEVNDDRKSGLMQSVLRWLTAGPEGRAIHTSILRAANYADRFNHSLLYVGWMRQMGLQPLTLTREQVMDLVLMQMEMAVASMMPEGMEESIPQMVDTLEAELFLMDKGNLETLAGYVYEAYPGLQQRGEVGRKEARKAARAILKGDPSVTIHQSYERANRPEVLALRYGIDYLVPSNTANDPRLQDVPWIALWRPYSAAQLKARATAEDWSEKWLTKVLEQHKGQPNFIVHHSTAHTWSTNPRWRDSQQALDYTYFILEVWEQATTADGCLAIHHTILHPDCADMVAKREVTPDWHGSYPFVALSIDPDEALLLEPRSLPELLHTTQDAIKSQVDSRSAAAALTTLPPRTGPATEAIHIPSPGGFVPVSPGREGAKFMDMPTPDGRSIEIERSLTAYASRLLGQPSQEVPEVISRLAAEDTSNTFLATVDHAYYLISQLLGQYMSPLKQARITGTQDTVTATAEDIRGGYDISVKFDSRALSPEYTEKILNFGIKAVPALDRRGDVNTLPMLRTLLNWMDPSLADASLPQDSSTITQQQRDQAIAALNDILNGGSPAIYKGSDPGALAQIITEEVQRSPLRQEIIQSHAQIRLVLGTYLKTLAAQNVQQNENPTTGLTLGKDPLREPTAAEQMSEMLLQEPPEEAPEEAPPSDMVTQ